jgi:HEAT repeat protein
VSRALQEHSDAGVRRECAEALGRVPDWDSSGVLAAALKDAKAEVRREAARSLMKRGDRQATAHLTVLLRDRDSSVRQAAVRALGAFGDAAALEAVRALASDRDSGVRLAVVEALASADSFRDPEPFLSVMTGRDFLGRQAAALALGRLGEPKAIPLLIDALDDFLVHDSVISALGMHKEQATVAQALSEAVRNHRKEQVRLHAATVRATAR